jgi:tetratricopeptide (TPR) repeat protein
MAVRFIDFPPELETFRVVAYKAFEAWVPDCEISFRRLKQGFSGAAVVRADVRPSGEGALESGEYIVKFSEPVRWENQESEDVCHERAEQFDPRFATKHVPRLRKIKHLAEITTADVGLTNIGVEPPPDSAIYTPGYAALYEIAGGSLARFAPLDRLDIDYILKVAKSVSNGIATHWSNQNPKRQLSVAELLADWLGYRIDPKTGTNLHTFVARHTHSSGTYIYGNRQLLDPLRFCATSTADLPNKIYIVDGLLHGDLHKGNVLVHQRDPLDHPFWIIDFALSRVGPVGFDHAYLEVGCLIDQAVTMPAVYYLDLVEAIFRNENISHLYSSSARRTGESIREVRRGLEQWANTVQKHRADHISQQLQLARIAAGLNWANKVNLDKSKRLAALAYSSLALDYFLKEHHRAIYQRIWEASTEPANGEIAPHGTSKLSEADYDLWKQLVAACHHFDSASNRYALVVDALPRAVIPKTLGPGCWSAIFDLDLKSDQNGLHQHVAPSLEQSRGVHIFDEDIPSLDLRRGTAWMMAGGWEAKKKTFKDDQEWRYSQLKLISRFAELLVQNTAPSPLFVFVIASNIDENYRAKRVIEAIDDASAGAAYFIILGKGDVANVDVRNKIEIPLSVSTFLRLLERNAVGSLFSDEPELPAPDNGRISIPYEKLRVIEENLIVLHSRILLDEGTQEELSAGAFWRGRPPSWRELDAGMDVTRSVHTELLKTLRQKLESYSTETQLLFHTPGSGGTTVAHRAAWDLHTEYPTAIVRSYTKGLADRIRELFQITQKSVLVVAESTILTETNREDLYRSLRQSNCRAVILYVRKIIDKKKITTGHVVPNPMTSNECEVFERSYASVVSEEGIKLRLRQVTIDNDFEQYRIPFFYGLIAFEREFVSVDRFVNSHLQKVRGRAREAIELLSFATLFSDHGLPKSLLAKIFGLAPTTDATIEAMVGEGASRLLVERDNAYRIMHQRIAEEILNWAYSTTGDDWRRHLQQLSLQFIETVSREAGSNSDFTLTLFRTIFIDRLGGDVDDVKDRQKFSPIIELLDELVDPSHGHQVFIKLTEECPNHSHFWMHRGRHHIYRLRGDARIAETYLERAVSLASSDPIIHHAYGLVLRYRVREMIRLARGKDARDVLDEILPFYKKAAEQFTIARELDPENMHGYVTHIQLNVNVCGAIKKLTDIKSIAQIRFTAYADLAEFTERAMVEAQTMLRNVSALYGTLTASQTRYVVICSKSIRLLYNDYDEAIRLLERADASGAGGPYVRRSLANAYLGRRERRWNALSTSEVRRVTDLMKRNLEGPGHQDDDYRLWFEGYRLLPEFDSITALDKLSVWSLGSTSWRPYYYLFVLTFIRWLNRDIISLEEMDVFISKSKERLIGRRTNSDFWLSHRFGKWALIHESELGEWDKDNKDRYKRFWKDPSPLSRKNGQIDRRIEGPQAATIVIEGVTKAFFVPGKAFSANKDENKLVNFYIGFSPEGIRAWSVEHGQVLGGNRTEETAPVVDDPQSTYEQISEGDKRDRARALQKSKVISFVEDIVKAASSQDRQLGLDEITERVDACFGIQEVYKSVGFHHKRDLVTSSPKLMLESVGEVLVVKLRDEEVAIDEMGDTTQKVVGYIDRVYDSSETVRIRAQNGRLYVGSYSVVRVGRQENIEVMTPVVVSLETRRGRTTVGSVEVVDDQVYVSEKGLVMTAALMDVLSHRFRTFSTIALTEAQFLHGIVPVARCFEFLDVKDFKALLAKVTSNVRGLAKLEAEHRQGSSGKMVAPQAIKKKARLLGADVSRLSTPKRGDSLGAPSKVKKAKPAPKQQALRPGVQLSASKQSNNGPVAELYETLAQLIANMPADVGVPLVELGNLVTKADPDWKRKLDNYKYKRLVTLLQNNDRFHVFGEGDGKSVRMRESSLS